MDKSRTDFEAWASQDGFDIYRNGDADYFNKVTQFAWEGWQASRTRALEEAANECDSYGAQLSKECAAAIRSLEGNAKETT